MKSKSLSAFSARKLKSVKETLAGQRKSSFTNLKMTSPDGVEETPKESAPPKEAPKEEPKKEDGKKDKKEKEKKKDKDGDKPKKDKKEDQDTVSGEEPEKKKKTLGLNPARSLSRGRVRPSSLSPSASPYAGGFRSRP